jgi:hypothetical protein
MITLLKTLLSAGGSALGGIWLYAAVFAAGTVIGGYGVGKVMHDADLSKYQALQLKDAAAATASLEAQAEALAKVASTQHTLDQEALLGAEAEAKGQAALTQQNAVIVKEVPVYVTEKADAVTCIPYGFVRVLDATILAGNSGSPVSPSDLALPADQSDDACAPVKASDLAASIAANYGTAQANAEQLNALEAFIHDEIERANQ